MKSLFAWKRTILWLSDVIFDIIIIIIIITTIISSIWKKNSSGLKVEKGLNELHSPVGAPPPKRTKRTGW